MSEPSRTIHDVTNDIRRRGLTADAAGFSRQLLTFAARFTPGAAESVLRLLATTTDNRERQLTLVWLANAGYGQTTTAVLATRVAQIRANAGR